MIYLLIIILIHGAHYMLKIGRKFRILESSLLSELKQLKMIMKNVTQYGIDSHWYN